MAGNDPRGVKDLAGDDFAKVRQLAKMAHELRCEITVGYITVRPVVAESSGESVRGAFAVLRAPLLAFLEKLGG